ncbi:hypothetical protein [Marinobacter sp. VGCF2001]|uniref:hypothetical protein n=1 Tax=Marinobacter sp. VGCF2001 TaxID=3417189 RepID=UPI003CE7B001
MDRPPGERPSEYCFLKDAGERFTKAIMLAEDLGFVSRARVFLAAGKFMEQEIILDE